MKFITTRTHTSLFACSATLMTLLSSCEMKKNLDEMHDATVAVGKQTPAMKQTTDELKELTCTMYRSLRQGNAKMSRDQDLVDMRKAEEISEKLAEASEYMQGFEYQVWSPSCENVISREKVMEQAVREFLAKLQGFSHKRDKVAATKTAEDYQNLYALAATLHYTNELQSSLLEGSNYSVYRPFDLLTEGLRINQEVDQGLRPKSDQTAWAKVVGKYRTDAIFILQLRQNFLLGYAYALLDSNDAGDAPSKLKKIWRVITSGTIIGKDWIPNLMQWSPTEQEERINTSLELAYETHQALVNLKVDSEWDQTMIRILKNMDMQKIQVIQSDLPAFHAYSHFLEIRSKIIESAK